MPVIPTVQRSQGIISVSGAPRRANIRGQLAEANAASQFFSQSGQTAIDVGRLQQRMDDAEAVNWVASTSAAGHKQWAAHAEEAKAAAPPGAPEFTPTIMKDYNAWVEKTLAEAPNERARNLGRRRFEAMGVQIFNDAVRFQGISQRANRMRSFEQGIGDLEDSLFAQPENFAEVTRQALNNLSAADSTWMTPREAAQYEDLPGRLAEAAMRGLIAQDPREAARMLAPDAEGNALVASLPVQRRVVLAQSAKAGVGDLDRADRQLAAEIAAQEAAKRDERVANLDLAISRGQAGYSEIDTAWNEGVLTAKERVSFIKQVDDRTEEQLEAQTQMAVVAAAISGEGVPLDPRNPDHREGVNLLFDNHIAPSLTDVPEAFAFSQITNFVARTGIVPDSVQGQIRGALRAGNEQQKAEAADFLGRLQEAAPAALNDFKQSDITAGLAIAQELRAGVEPVAAVRLVEQRLAQDPMKLETVARIARDQKHVEANEDYLEDLSSSSVGLLQRTPDVPIGLLSEFNRKQQDYFAIHNDLETSQELAKADVLRVWAVSDVGGQGRRWMAYAPESFGPQTLSDSENAEWMNRQLLADVTGTALLDPSAGAAAERIAIAADAITARQAQQGAMPSYAVVLRDATSGAFVPIFEADGSRMRWQPDWTASPEYKAKTEAQKAETEEVMEKARRQRRSVTRTKSVEPPAQIPGLPAPGGQP